MRFHIIGFILLAGVAAPAPAQRDSVERRVDRIEQELRAVQRRVFPSGAGQMVEPEIRPDSQQGMAGTAGGNALSNLTARVDALEAQLRTITGQTEENGHRLRQLESEIERLRADTMARLDAIERAARAPAPAEQPAAEPDEAEPAQASDDAPAAQTDPAEAAYNAGFRLWDAKKYGEAQQALEAAAERYSDSRWASWARNLAGRAYLDDAKPATAARIFLANYQKAPRGERAADSLYFLGQALTRLDRLAEACRVYDELEEVYPGMRGFIRDRLSAARVDARCGE